MHTLPPIALRAMALALAPVSATLYPWKCPLMPSAPSPVMFPMSTDVIPHSQESVLQTPSLRKLLERAPYAYVVFLHKDLPFS